MLERIKKYVEKIEQPWKRKVILAKLSDRDRKLIADIRAQKITYSNAFFPIWLLGAVLFLMTITIGADVEKQPTNF